MEKVNKTSENLEKLRNVFPEFVKDGIVDFDALEAFFEENGKLPDGQEKYGLNWAGKSNAFKLIKTPATGTLTPDEKESKDFENTENLFIEGDNLEVLKLLQKHYREKIKMIYIDPPYNTGKDFIYKDNFREDKFEFEEITKIREDGVLQTSGKLTQLNKGSARYHSDWLTMMYPRLFLARNLLKEDGVIFISIDDNEVANLRMIIDEIFGEENFIETLIWKKRATAPNDRVVGRNHEYVLAYAKNQETVMLLLQPRDEAVNSRYSNPDNDPLGPWSAADLSANGKGGRLTQSCIFPIINPHNGKNYLPPKNKCWLYNQEKVEQFLQTGKIGFRQSSGTPFLKRYLSEVRSGITLPTIIDNGGYSQDSAGEIKELFNENVFDFPKPVKLIKKILNVGLGNDDFVLDFFAGSGTTAHAVMDLNAEDEGNRKWICVQLPEITEESSEARKAGFENISQIARERIRRAGKKIGKGDIGFKALTLSKSNYREWNVLSSEGDSEILKQQMKLINEKPLVDDFDEKSVVYEILVKEGFDLNSEVKKENDVWIVKDGEKKLVVSFASNLTQEQVDSFGLNDDDLFVCLDSALDDTTKVNILRRKFNVKVI